MLSSPVNWTGEVLELFGAQTAVNFSNDGWSINKASEDGEVTSKGGDDDGEVEIVESTTTVDWGTQPEEEKDDLDCDSEIDKQLRGILAFPFLILLYVPSMLCGKLNFLDTL
jgi:hypothetical protein